MPMKRHLYPSNWNTIATIVKYQAGWRCEQCDRPCIKPNQAWDEFCEYLWRSQSDFFWETFEEGVDEETGKDGYREFPGRFRLTVAHLDQNPGNNSRDNLKALCPTCHNRHDAKARAINRSHTRVVKLEDAGQLRIKGV